MTTSSDRNPEPTDESRPREPGLREVVAIVPVDDVTWTGLGLVGFVTWTTREWGEHATFVVRTRCPWIGDDESLFPGEPSAGHDPAHAMRGILEIADMAPFRGECDVTVTGTARRVAGGGERAASLRVGDRTWDLILPFDASGACAAEKARARNGDALALGGLSHLVPIEGGSIDVDLAPFQRSSLRAPKGGAGTEIALDGFFDAPIVRRVGFEPRIVFAGASESDELALTIDSIAIDLDAGSIELVWTTACRWPARIGRVDRVEVYVLPRARVEAGVTAADRREVPRSEFHRLVRLSDAHAGVAPPPLTHDELAFERMSAFADVGTNARLDAEEVGTIWAELAHGGESRAGILDRAGLDEISWAFEERAAVERLALEAIPDEEGAAPAFATALGSAYAARLQSLAPPPEMSIEAYAVLRARLEHEPVAKVLDDAHLTVGTFSLLRDRMERAKDADAALAATYEELLDEARGRIASKEAES